MPIGPERGTCWIRRGRADNKKYGKAIPVPMAANVTNVVAGFWVAAHATAAPINGAVQGVERTAVKMPITKEPGKVSWLG